jgi:hypothetical protein
MDEQGFGAGGADTNLPFYYVSMLQNGFSLNIHAANLNGHHVIIWVLETLGSGSICINDVQAKAR